MTVKADDGPAVTTGIQPPIGTVANAGQYGAPYVSGSNENPDAAPNISYGGDMVKDVSYRYEADGTGLAAGGYPHQALGFLAHEMQTIDLVPSTIATANIAALQGNTSGTALTLVSVTGAGITVETADVTVLNTGNVVPAGSLRIDASPAWTSYGTSGAFEAWRCAACDRGVSLTSAANLSGINYTLRGYDIYGNPVTSTRAGPNANTVNFSKTVKWIASITPDATNASTVSVGTADVFGFPVRADRFSQTTIWWDETLVTANTGFVAAVTTSPATALTGDVRGKYATQSASDSVKRLVVLQRLPPANVAQTTSQTAMVGMFGVTQA